MLLHVLCAKFVDVYKQSFQFAEKICNPSNLGSDHEKEKSIRKLTLRVLVNLNLLI
jgi:hypothetical protein